MEKDKVNPDLIIAGVYRPDDHYYGDYGECNEVGRIHIFAAPRIPIFEAGELDAFTKDLVAGIDGIVVRATRFPEAHTNSRMDYVMYLGDVTVTDVVGRRIKIVDLAESPGVFKEMGIWPSAMRSGTILTDIARSTHLNVYPHEEIARQAFPSACLGGEELMYGRITRTVWKTLEHDLSCKLPYRLSKFGQIMGSFGF